MKGLYCFCFLLFSVLFTHVYAQIPTGGWRIFSPNEHVIGVEHDQDVIYAAFELGVLVYDVNYKEKSLWTIANGLSDSKITAFGKHEQSGSIVIGYENGNIDLIKNEKIHNIPGLKLANNSGVKQIFSFSSNGRFIHANTGLGIVLIDPSRYEIKDTYYPSISNERILSSELLHDTLFALTPNRLLKCAISNPAISNAAYWSEVINVPVSTTTDWKYGQMIQWKNELVISKINASYAFDTLFRRTASHYQVWQENGGYIELNNMKTSGNKIAYYGADFIHIYDDWNNLIFQQNQYPFGSVNITAFDFHKDKIIIGDLLYGLIIREYNGELIRIQFEGPKRSDAFRLDWLDGTLVLAPGNNSGIAPNYTGIGAGIFKDEKWKYVWNDPYWQNRPVWDNGAISINPKNKKEFAVGTLSMLPVSILSMDGHVIDTFSRHNSTLEVYANNNMGWYFINDLSYDSKGNLWIINGNVTSVLKVKDKDGNWGSINLGYNSSNKLGHRIYVDYFDNVWVIMKGNGVIGYKPGDNVTATSDDKKAHLNSASLLGEMWPSSNVTAVTMDFDNKLWIGTDQGFCILHNANTIFDKAPGSYTVQRPKVKATEEGNYEEFKYVLGSISITDIAVDGGNRKWLGTSSAGVILMTPDGQEILEHFTIENSPLLSNTILDIEIDHKTGEVYFVTDKGMISYRGSATHEDPTYSDVKIFPNPVTPDFNGYITIQGIMYDSDIKITDVAGNVVYKTTSSGGTATWNGLDFDGNRVATGVYLFWTASNTKKGKFVGKVAVISE